MMNSAMQNTGSREKKNCLIAATVKAMSPAEAGRRCERVKLSCGKAGQYYDPNLCRQVS